MASTRPSEPRATARGTVPATVAATTAAAGTRGRRLLAGAASTAFLLATWSLAARAIGKDIVLPGPLRVLEELILLAPDPAFLESVAGTFLRGLAAFLLSATAGGIAGMAAGLLPAVDAALAPLLTVMRATPILALILLFLIWLPSGFVPVFAAFLMAFPVMVASASAGAKAADPELLEMARLFRVPPRLVLFRITLPSAASHLVAGARAALGMSWKVVVSVEVMSQPPRAIGSGLKDAYSILETPRMVAWVAAAIALCGLAEWVFGVCASRALRRGL